MTRKDYKLIAQALYQSKPAPHHGVTADAQWHFTRSKICQALAQDNPRFDPVKFLSACNEG